MKSSINKTQHAQKYQPYSNRQFNSYVDGLKPGRYQSSSTLSKNNSKNKSSRLDTNESRNEGGNSSMANQKFKHRLKTQGKNHDMQSTNEKSPNKKSSSIVKRIRTDISERIESPAFQLRFDEDHLNTDRLTGLHDYRENYHDDPDQEQFNAIVRRETQGSKLSKLEEEKPSSSQKSSRNGQSSKQERSSRKQSTQQKEDEKYNDDDQEEDQSSKRNKPSKSSIYVDEKSSKGKKSYTLLEEERPSAGSYSLGATVGYNQQPNFKKKPRIRYYSHEDKLKIINQNKYLPKNQSEIRMEMRFLKGQMNSLHQVRQTQQLAKMMDQYQNHKRLIMQQSMKKLEVVKIISTMKLRNRQNQELIEERIKKSMSLPKIKPCRQFLLPDPDELYSKSPQEEIQLKKINQNCCSLKDSLSANRYYYMNKKQCLMKKEKAKQDTQNQVQNIESVLRSKGIDFDVNAIRKGIISMKTMPDVDSSIRFELPKSLVSNPRYQKYPL